MRLCARIVGFMLVGSLLAFAAPVRAQVCGDGLVDPGETCDPPNPAVDPVTGQSICRPDCTFCGDGIVDVGHDESCDIGPFATCGGCQANCTERIFVGEGFHGCPGAFDDPSLVDLRADILAACQCGNASSHGALGVALVVPAVGFAQPTQVPASAGGAWAHVDPQTGKLVPRPAGVAAVPAAIGAFSTSHQGLAEEPAPGGGMMIDLQGRFRSAATATVGPDGTARVQCEPPGARGGKE